MMKHEFEQMAGYRVSYEDYAEIIEPMYNATNLDKIDFVKVIDRKRFELKEEKSQERIDLENQINNEIRGLKESIEYDKTKIQQLETYLEDETEEEWIKEWKKQIKTAKHQIKLCKNRIATLKWVLE